jgi:hypothetical protein
MDAPCRFLSASRAAAVQRLSIAEEPTARPSPGSVAAHTSPAALCATGRAPMAGCAWVGRVSPGQTAFTLRRPLGCLPKLSMSPPVASVAVRRVRGKLRASAAECKWQRLHVRGPHHRRQPVPPAHQATMGRRGQSRSSPLAPPHELISQLTCAYVVRELKGLAVVERCSFARTLRRFTTGSPSSAYRLLSDQLSDYGVDGPYIQPDIHGLSSRSVPDLDDSPTVLRDEEIAGCHPDHKTPGQRRIQIPDWSIRLQVQPPPLPAWSACRMHIKINQKSRSGNGRVSLTLT